MRHIAVALLIRNGRVLLARRSPHRHAYPGVWSFPGGHAEAGETLEQALVREAGEEIAVFPTDYAPLGTIRDPQAGPADPVLYHLYTVTAWQGGEPRMANDEHTSLAWLTFAAAAALPDLALEEFRAVLQTLGPRDS